MAACGGGQSEELTVLVDYSSDDFASSAFFNFPAKLDATPGQTIVFKQTWTGEPHTVTGGTFVNDTSCASRQDWLSFFEAFDGLLAEDGADHPEPRKPGQCATFADFVNGV